MVCSIFILSLNTKKLKFFILAGDSQAVVQNGANSTALSAERQFSGESSFSRTIWLPRRVDSAGVAAKLEDGILTVRIPKAEDLESVKISID